jgi:hypothetical protein
MFRTVSGTGSRQRPVLETLEDRLVPSTMAIDATDGVWRYNTSTGWAHISNMPASELAVDDSGDIYGRFNNGIWRWDASSLAWMKLSTENDATFQGTGGGVLYVSLGSLGNEGTWRWSFAGWQKLSDFGPYPGAYTVSNSDVLFARFDHGPVGTWRWSPSTGWGLLSNSRPNAMHADDAGDFVGTFSSYIASTQVGTWRWNPSSGWARLSTAAPVNMKLSGNGTIFEDRGPAGIWSLAVGANTFAQISSTNTHFSSEMIALPDGGLFLELNEGKPGSPQPTSGWYWNASTGWSLFLADASHFSDAAAGADGDVFICENNVSTWLWSPSTPIHPIGGAQYLSDVFSQRGSFP